MAVKKLRLREVDLEKQHYDKHKIFATVISQIITPLVPKITSERYSSLYDVTQVGFGDNASYIVESNELFIVNEGAEGIARGGQQTVANNEYTVSAHKRTISVGVDWYHIASGKMDWGMFGLKVAKSFENYINASVIKALTSVVSYYASYKPTIYRFLVINASISFATEEAVNEVQITAVSARDSVVD